MSSEAFRHHLQSELVRRCRANRRYSLRAFARALDYDVATLSKLLNGKRAMGPRLIRRMGDKLGMPDGEVRRFLYERDLARAETNLPPTIADHDFHALSREIIEVIADWHHYAILELLYVDGFRPRAAWIARRLGITTREAEIAIRRLKRVGLLGEDWRETKGDRLTTTGNPFTTEAFRNMQRQLLMKALTALDAVPMEKRDHSSMTMSIDTRKLPAAKEKIKRFRREMSSFLTRVESRDAVYALTVALFPLTQTERKSR